MVEKDDEEDKDDSGGIGEGKECGADGAAGAAGAEETEDDDEAKDNGDAVVEGKEGDVKTDGNDALGAPLSPSTEMRCTGMCRRSARVSDVELKTDPGGKDELSEREGG